MATRETGQATTTASKLMFKNKEMQQFESILLPISLCCRILISILKYSFSTQFTSLCSKLQVDKKHSENEHMPKPLAVCFGQVTLVGCSLEGRDLCCVPITL